MQPHHLTDITQSRQQFFQRVLVLGLLMFLVLFVLVGWVFYLQSAQFENYQTLSNRNRISVVPIAPPRGLIYDQYGELVAYNQSVHMLEVVPEQVDDIESSIQNLQNIITLDEATLKRFRKSLRQKRSFQRVVIKQNLSNEELAKFAVDQHLYPGFYSAARLVRHYPDSEYFAHAMGYMGRINAKEWDKIDQSNYRATTHIGKLGLEKYYESVLHGEAGYQEVETDVVGRVVRTLNKLPPKPGYNLQLTLDKTLQKTAHDALSGQRGAVVVLDANTGAVRTLVSTPSFDPNLFVTGISHADYKAYSNDPDKPLYHRAVRGHYSPGSTIKPHLALVGLQTGVVTPKTSIPDPGYYQLTEGGRKYRDHTRWGHGHVNLNKAIQVSCDTYFYQLANKLGIDRLHDGMVPFGFGGKTGIDLYEESAGILPSRDWKKRNKKTVWYPGETLNVGIGQGFWTSTPLQLAQSILPLANGGKLYAPRLVEMVFQGEEQIQHPSAQSQIPWEFDEKHLRTIQKSMFDVVHSPGGTARRAFQGAPYRSAGKTGTVQLFGIKQEEEYDEKKVAKRLRDNAMYVGYMPYNNPEVVIAVVVENAGHGSASAAPIARQVLDAYWQLKKNRAKKQMRDEVLQ